MVEFNKMNAILHLMILTDQYRCDFLYAASLCKIVNRAVHVQNISIVFIICDTETVIVFSFVVVLYAIH